MLNVKGKKISLFASAIILMGLVGCVKKESQLKKDSKSNLTSFDFIHVEKAKKIYMRAIEEKEINPSSIKVESTNESPIEYLAYKNTNENIALVDARIRTINTTTFLKELLIVDFSKNKEVSIPETFTYEEIVFSDNGSGYDEVKGDGLFTAVTPMNFTEQIPYIEGQDRRSVLSSAVVNESFKHTTNLLSYIESNSIKYKTIQGVGTKTGPVLTISCDFYWVCGCWNSCCGWVVRNCNFTIGWG